MTLGEVGPTVLPSPPQLLNGCNCECHFVWSFPPVLLLKHFPAPDLPSESSFFFLFFFPAHLSIAVVVVGRVWPTHLVIVGRLACDVTALNLCIKTRLSTSAFAAVARRPDL